MFGKSQTKIRSAITVQKEEKDKINQRIKIKIQYIQDFHTNRGSHRKMFLKIALKIVLKYLTRFGQNTAIIKNLVTPTSLIIF